MTKWKTESIRLIASAAAALSIAAFFGPSARGQGTPPPVPPPPPVAPPPAVPLPATVPGKPPVVDPAALPPPPPDNSPKQRDLAGMVADTPRLSTLLNAIKAAGLEDTLKQAGPYTLLAPANTAFRDVSQASLTQLMLPENRTTLTALLKGHIVAGRYTRADLAKLGSNAELKTLAGTTLKITNNRGIGIANARPMQVDLAAQNGVIHIIDTVLQPTPTTLPVPVNPEGGAPPAAPPAAAPPTVNP